MADRQEAFLPELSIRMHLFHVGRVDNDQALDIHQAPAPDSALIFLTRWAEGGDCHEA